MTGVDALEAALWMAVSYIARGIEMCGAVVTIIGVARAFLVFCASLCPGVSGTGCHDPACATGQGDGYSIGVPGGRGYSQDGVVPCVG